MNWAGMVDKSAVRPCLKWAGGKRQLLAEITMQFPKDINNYIYYEPFVGGGAVFFGLMPAKAVISDCNDQLIVTYHAIKENVEDLIVLLKEHQKKNCHNYYYEIRNMDRDTNNFRSLSNAEKAARLIFLNRTCYNGLYRVNSKGFFNVPYGKHKNPAICGEIVLRAISAYFNTGEITILRCDFENAVSAADDKSFIYFDPPYHSPGKANFTAYQAGGFGEGEQKRLCGVITELTKRGVKCLLSNSDTKHIRQLYANDVFEIMPVYAKRAINSNSTGRGAVSEVLIKNWRHQES